MCRANKGCMALIMFGMLSPAFAIGGATPIPFTSPVATPILLGAGGKYLVTRNLTPTGPGPLIEIATPADVVLDLGGFTLDNSANPGDPVILVSGGPASEVFIRNGILLGGTAGVLVPVGAAEVVIEDVKAADTGIGFGLTGVTSFAIRDSIVLRTTANAILAGGPGIRQGTIEDNLIQGTAGGIAIRTGSSVAILNNRVEAISPSPIPVPPFLPEAGGGILLVDTDACLVSNNTIEDVRGPGGKGIRVVDTHGCKFYNNVVMKVEEEGILLDGTSFDDLVLHNVIVHAGWDGFAPTFPFDGVFVMADGNHLNQNQMNRNGLHGLHFAASANDNNYGRNTAVGNFGPPCPSPVGPNSDFCDESGDGVIDPFDNYSFADNLMPGVLGLF